MIHFTYTGSCSIDNKVFLCSNMVSSLEQKVAFFDHTLGLRDVFSSDFESKGSSPAKKDLENTQKRVYRYTPALAKASISGPIPEHGFQDIIDKAVSGEEIEIEMAFYKHGSPVVTVGRAIISTLNMNVKAGDICNFSLEAVGAEYGLSSGSAKKASCMKLVTWDAARISATPISDLITSFNVTINNPPIPIYTAGSGMMPKIIRIGMQEAIGTIGVYGTPIINAPSIGEVDFSFNGAGKKMAVVFTSPSDTGDTRAYIRSINFSGAKDGTIWSATGHGGC